MANKKISSTIGIALLSFLLIGCNDSKPKTEPVKEEVKQETTKEPVKTLPIKIEEDTKPTKELVQNKIAQVTKSPDAKTLFQKCSACHGTNAQKKALNKSAIIKDWDETKIANALKGYKAGTYGGAMKGVMQAQASTLSDKEIELLAKYISDFQ